MLDFTVEPKSVADLRRMSTRVRRSMDGPALRRDAVKQLRAAVKPVERDVKAAALALPASAGSAGVLRRRIAGAVGTQVRLSGRSAGVRLRVRKTPLGSAENLPQRMNTGQWRHPVYGNRDVWVTQHSRRGWFDATARAARPRVRRQVKQVFDDIERKLSQ
jgi:hypothetical protein